MEKGLDALRKSLSRICQGLCRASEFVYFFYFFGNWFCLLVKLCVGKGTSLYNVKAEETGHLSITVLPSRGDSAAVGWGDARAIPKVGLLISLDERNRNQGSLASSLSYHTTWRGLLT